MAPSEDPRPSPLGAATLMVALAWGVARPAPPPDPAACPVPQEGGSVAGWTVWVDCDPLASPRPLRGSSPLLFGGTLDLNRAAPGVLEVLPGIGRVRAEAIARERARRPFGAVGEVVRVRGIGPGVARGLAGWARADPVDRPGPTETSQKRGQLLPNPSENSYKERARRDPCARAMKREAAVDDSPAGGRAGGLASQ